MNYIFNQTDDYRSPIDSVFDACEICPDVLQCSNEY